ncbi:MAG TPA: PilW family protein [Steroidobacteraceae bacterium]|nr:PilW family protein [Steroidobacteraceae bacterium]
MSAARRQAVLPGARRARGFTLVELMVTVAIALFLLGGLVTVLENTRSTYGNQQALAQFQDRQRFAMAVLTSVIEAGGYYPSPTGETQISALLPLAPNFGSGQAFYGTGTAGAAPGDTLDVRFRTTGGDGIINCSGGGNTGGAGVEHTYINEFSIVAGQLACALSVDGGAFTAPVPLVSGVTNLRVYYGVKRLTPFSDYNVDTYVPAASMNGSDWSQVSAVRVILTFANPLANQPGQPATLDFERVVEVMARAGEHT